MSLLRAATPMRLPIIGKDVAGRRIGAGEVRRGDADRLTLSGLSNRFTVALRFLPNFCSRATDWFWLRSRNGRKRPFRVRVGLVGSDAVLKNVVVRASRSSHENSANEPNRGKRGSVNCQSTHRIAQPHYSRTAGVDRGLNVFLPRSCGAGIVDGHIRLFCDKASEKDAAELRGVPRHPSCDQRVRTAPDLEPALVQAPGRPPVQDLVEPRSIVQSQL